MCNKRCKSCSYSAYLSNGQGAHPWIACCYILDTGSRRPCAAGDVCTVYKPKRTLRSRTTFNPSTFA